MPMIAGTLGLEDREPLPCNDKQSRHQGLCNKMLSCWSLVGHYDRGYIPSMVNRVSYMSKGCCRGVITSLPLGCLRPAEPRRRPLYGTWLTDSLTYLAKQLTNHVQRYLSCGTIYSVSGRFREVLLLQGIY